MIEYQNFVGIDIGKFNFVVALDDNKSTFEYENTTAGVFKFIDDYKDILSNTLIVEPTGGYEIELLYTLCDKGCAVHRADTRKVKRFIESYGNAAKTDALDAKALANYGKERQEKLALFKPQTKQSLRLFKLVQRSRDLNNMLVAEKNRLQTKPEDKVIKNSCKFIIKSLVKQITAIRKEIQEMINKDSVFKKRQEILKSIPGIGDIISSELLILLPELGGTTTRRQIASLAGVAPRAKDSGKFKGYRKTGGGRAGIKPLLFLAAMAARRSNSYLKEFYENLIARGKKKMVALTALMRKIIVIANARLKTSSVF